FLCGGWLNELYGWRVTLMLVAMPGLALACLIWLTVKEPRAMQSGADAGFAGLAEPSTNADETPPLRVVWSHLWKTTTFRHLLIAISLVGFFVTGRAKWQPTFFIRSYGMETGELGLWLALTSGAA